MNMFRLAKSASLVCKPWRSKDGGSSKRGRVTVRETSVGASVGVGYAVSVRIGACFDYAVRKYADHNWCGSAGPSGAAADLMALFGKLG